MPSPLSCSRVIFKTRASKSRRDRCPQTRFRRRVRSFRTQSSLLSGLSESRSGELKPILPLARTHFSEIDILPHMAAEASPERRGRRVGAVAAVLPRLLGAYSRELESKDVAKRAL